LLIDRNEKESLSIALDITDSFFRDKDKPRQLPEQLAYDLLSNPIFFTDRLDTMQGYHWEQLAELFLNTYPERDLELFRLIMERLENWRFIILKSTSAFHTITAKIVKEKPSETWGIIHPILEDLQSDTARGILHWLEEEDNFGDGPGIRPLTYFPYDEIMAWIELDPENRAPAIARACPSTLNKDDDGRITHEILDKYGDMDSVKSAIFGVFYYGSYSGPSSAYHRRKRDQARTWFEGETSQTIINWLEEYIDVLSKQIESDEIREERGLH